jgi:hypothetical protein
MESGKSNMDKLREIVAGKFLSEKMESEKMESEKMESEKKEEKQQFMKGGDKREWN